jgi:putative transposase
VLFIDTQDYDIFISILKDLVSTVDIDIHAYTLMPTYFEFLSTPLSENTLSKFMQSLGRRYVGYYNKKYNRTGTLWSGRYKSSIVEDIEYLFDIMNYIEQLPSKNTYNSKGKNLLNIDDNIVKYHKLYKDLGYTPDQRVSNYRKIISNNINSTRLAFILDTLNRQTVTGTIQYIKDLENLIGLSLLTKQRGRPKKQKKDIKMYKNLVVLDKTKHSDLKISPLENLNFAKQSVFIPVVATEVEKVAAVFPVVFTADENPSLIALVSLGGDSLAITNDGKWITSYVPSFLRKYPFSLASTQENSDQKVILIDEDASVLSKSKGKKLFKKNGDKSETLENAINFLTAYEIQATITKNVAKLIADAGILEDREIAVGEGEEKKVLVNGFKVVNKEKLNELSDDILASWVRKGIISMIDAHLKSLDHIQTLFNIAHQRQN